MQRYKVLVVGHIWWPNGFHSNEYEFDAENDEDAEERVDQVAGDFSIVTDFELYRCESCPTCGQTVWECFREFSEDDALTYIACVA